METNYNPVKYRIIFGRIEEGKSTYRIHSVIGYLDINNKNLAEFLCVQYAKNLNCDAIIYNDNPKLVIWSCEHKVDILEFK